MKSGVISLGGNVQAIGTKTDGSRWKVGVQSPDDTESMIGAYEAADEAVITSGAYERYFEKDGKTYHHIIDPATGKPSEKDLKSVTIISKMVHYLIHCQRHCLLWGRIKLFLTGRNTAKNSI